MEITLPVWFHNFIHYFTQTDIKIASKLSSCAELQLQQRKEGRKRASERSIKTWFLICGFIDIRHDAEPPDKKPLMIHIRINGKLADFHSWMTVLHFEHLWNLILWYVLWAIRLKRGLETHWGWFSFEGSAERRVNKTPTGPVAPCRSANNSSCHTSCFLCAVTTQRGVTGRGRRLECSS